MIAFCLGTIGFVLYLIYDFNSIANNNRLIQKFFLIGSVLVVVSTILCVYQNIKFFVGVRCVLAIVLAVVFFIALIYTLFFALPFEATYVEDSKERLAYTEGVYAICRHPGVLWFAGLYICLWALIGFAVSAWVLPYLILWNLLYILVQDYVIFPKTFTNYATYKKTTPFLIPNGKSIRDCIKNK